MKISKNVILNIKNLWGVSRSLKYNAKIFFCTIFFVLISLPILLKTTNFTFDYGLINERRNLSEFPSFTESDLKAFTGKLDLYFKDRIPFRNSFLTSYIFLCESLLESYENEYVTGKSHNLFMNHAAQTVNSSLGIIKYDNYAQEMLRLSAAGKYAYFYSKNIPYYQIIVPDKATLYPELLPFYANWIKHNGWYKEQIRALKQAKIPYIDLKLLFDKNRTIKFYDVIYDTEHWNGNALMLAYPYIASIISRDNSMFRPVKKDKYYSSYPIVADQGLYGKESTNFVKLNSLKGVTCGLPPKDLQLQGNPYQKLCINKNKLDGTLWFFSDSYFGGTHGSASVTPFVFNVRNYFHSHYNIGQPYTEVADKRMSLYKPDAVIEEFVERMGGTFHALGDPKIAILGDVWLHTGGFMLDSHLKENIYVVLNGSLKSEFSDSPNKNKLIINSSNVDPMVVFKNPVVADYLGRVVVMAKYISPDSTFAQVFYRSENGKFSESDSIKQNVIKGDNLVHLTIHVKPFEKVYLRFDPGAVLGDYVFEDIPEVNDLRNRMKEDGI